MYSREKMSAPILMFAETPNLNELCAMTVHLSKTIQQQSSSMQPHILKCREIIFTESSIIATPAHEVQNAFHIVLKQNLYRTGRIQARFKKIGLEYSKPQLVSKAMFESCLIYTILARIAPKWNKAGSWLIQGRDFLSCSGYANSVKMNLTVNQEDICFSLDATAVHFQPLQVEDLDVCGSSYDRFLKDSQAKIDQCAISSPWCHVLPSMKKGQVVCITHELPADGPFKSYRDLKRHWKNTYGYRLPESGEGNVYYQVHFRPLGGRLFTYPKYRNTEFCLRARDIERVPRVDPKPILAAFLQDVQAKLSNICDSSVRLQNKARYPVIELLQCDLTKDQQIHPNLSSKQASNNKKILYRSSLEVQQLLSRNTDKREPSMSTPQSMCCHVDSNTQSNHETASLPVNPSTDTNSFSMTSQLSLVKSITKIAQKFENIKSETVLDNSKGLLCDSTDRSTVKSVLGAQSFVSQGSKPSFCMNKSNNSKKIVPIFITKKQKTFDCNVVKPSGHTVVPNFTANGKDTFFSRLQERQGFLDGTGTGNYTETNIEKVAQRNEASQSLNPAANIKFKGRKQSLMSVTVKGQPVLSSQKSFIADTSIPSTNTGMQNISTPVHISKKRTIQIQDDPPKEKKPRSKPQIQDLDIESLAKSHQLHKANTVTLVAWLKQRGIICKTKDKKTDILDKIRSALNLTAEQ